MAPGVVRLAGLNPLHCGAVVASGRWRRGRSRAAPRSFPSLRGSGRFAQATKKSGAKARPVSIPFIAGQWSLPAGASRSRTGTARVSIPFIAGQWSLRFRGYCRSSHHHQVSIPFIAGQWSLPTSGSTLDRRGPEVSIPFIAGQWSLRAAGAAVPLVVVQFQSPSLRGSGRFTSRSPAPKRIGTCFNPLHCGAVVASSRPPPGSSTNPGFNPLHCGAVVASGRVLARPRRSHAVSIPFIAGQWSLHAPLPRRGEGDPLFQSPSLRGSGRFTSRSPAPKRIGTCFNPLHCGAVVASGGDHRRAAGPGASFNPLHCGAVVASFWERLLL